MGGRGVRVAICVATWRRPEWLGELLESVGRLRFDRRQADPVVIVVDNDVGGSAAPVVAQARAAIPWEIHYTLEPRRGISYARNRAVALAREQGADFVAFVDDDELVEADWLDALLDVQARYGADVVTGSVLPRYTPGVPGWAVRGRFFERPRHATGTVVDFAATNNTLVAMRVFDRHEAPFDPRFGLTGGGDTHFFMRARLAGARIVFANEAVVEDRVPPERACARWILQRAYREGNAIVWCERDLQSGRRWAVPRLVKSVGRIVQGVVLLAPSGFAGRAGIVRSCARIMRGAGALSATLGVRYHEYRRRAAASSEWWNEQDAPSTESAADA